MNFEDLSAFISPQKRQPLKDCEYYAGMQGFLSLKFDELLLETKDDKTILSGKCCSSYIAELSGIPLSDKQWDVSGSIERCSDNASLVSSLSVEFKLPFTIDNVLFAVDNVSFGVIWSFSSDSDISKNTENFVILCKCALPACNIASDIKAVFPSGDRYADVILENLKFPVKDISDLCKITGIDDITTYLPDFFKNTLTKLELSVLRAKLEFYGGFEILELCAIIEIPDINWNIWQNHLVVKEIKLSVETDYSGYSVNKNRFGITGTVEIFGKQVSVAASSTSDFEFFINLEDSIDFSLGEYLNELCPGFSIPDAKMSIDKFYAAIAYGKKYEAMIKICSSPDSAWDIAIGSKTITINDISLRLQYGESGFSGYYGGSLQLSDTLTLSIYAESGEKLVIKGGIYLDGQADFWDLFSDYAIPDWLKSAKMKKLELEYSENVKISLECDIDVNAVALAATVNLEFGKTLEICGNIFINGHEFTLAYKSENTDSILYAVLDSEKEPIELTPSLLGLQGDVAIKAKKAYLALVGGNNGSVTSFGVTLDTEIDFSSIPVAGSLLPSDDNLKISRISVCFNSETFTKEQQSFLEKHSSDCGIKVYAAGISVSGEFLTPSSEPILLNSADNAVQTPVNPSAMQPADTANKSKIKWISINKNFGVINLSRLGIGLKESSLAVLLDAAVTLGCFKCSLTGAGITSPVTAFNPKFELGGISLDYNTPAVSVSGLILKQDRAGMKYYYSGGIGVKLSQYGFVAETGMGETTSGVMTFSLYFAADINLVVSPAVIITQLSAAFGYNEKINEPAVEKVNEYPLVTGDIAALNTMKDFSLNDYWAAAGVKFTVSQLINGSLVLLARFGNDLSFDIIGNAGITLPKGSVKDNAYLHADVNILASLKPREGYFSLKALLSNESFLFTHQCKLTGGLAFNLWFGENEHAGDFVFTIGGYHPHFTVPAHYPAVPRVGFLWNISNELSMKGEAYLALTPSCVMAGGRLEAAYQSGTVKAWFIAGADLLMTFHPFGFDAEIYINIGASVRLNLSFFKTTLSFSVGADLHLWGTPTGGTVTIHLSVLSFTISFGGSKPGNDPISVDAFKELLPESIHTLGVSDGLTAKENENHIVNSFGSRFFIKTAIPLGKINIRPLGVQAADSDIAITLRYNNALIPFAWEKTAITANIPEVLWGQPIYNGKTLLIAPIIPAANLIPEQTVGYVLTPPEAEKGETITFDITGKKPHKVELSLIICSYLLPQLRIGKYNLSATQSVAGITANSTLDFEVRLSGGIDGRFPLPDDTGEYDYTLPHIAFSVPTYPFEIDALGHKSPSEPWLVLVTLSEDEMKGVSITSSKVKFDSAFIKSILPIRGELPYLAHCRQVTANSSQYGDAGEQPQSFVLSNRFPAKGLNWAILLSLKDVDIDTISGDFSEFTMLDQFQFFSQDNGIRGFAHIVNHLSKDLLKTDDENGYIKLPYGLEQSLWRGLFSPVKTLFSAPSRPRYITAKSAVNNSDVSLSSAFENARLAAIADTALLQSLFAVRSKIAKTADAADSFSARAYDGKNLFDTVLSGFSTAIGLSDIKSINDPLKPASYDNSVYVSSNYLIEESQELDTLISRTYETVLQQTMPEQFLFPVLSPAPDESIRFFYIDKNVISAALDGIFSIGVESKRQTEINDFLYKYVSDRIWDRLPGGDMTGFVLNSSLLEIWKNTEVYAFDANGNEIDTFSVRKSGETKRVYIYKGEIKNIILREPPHTLSNSLDEDGNLMVKDPSGNVYLKKVTADCFRQDGRTLNMLRLAELAGSDSPAELALDLLKTPEQVTVDFTEVRK